MSLLILIKEKEQMESRQRKAIFVWKKESYLSQVWKNNELPSVSSHFWAKADWPLHNPTSDLIFEKQMVQFYSKIQNIPLEWRYRDYFKWKRIRIKHNFKRLSYFSKLRLKKKIPENLCIFGVTITSMNSTFQWRSSF